MLKKSTATSFLMVLLFLAEFVASEDVNVPWTQITPAPAIPPSLNQRDYDTADPSLYGYTSVGMNGTRTRWSSVFCGANAPTMIIETFQDTVFGGCWEIATVDFFGLFAASASADFVTDCSGHIAIGTSSTYQCPTVNSTIQNCVFDTLYPDLATTSATIVAICADTTVGNTYFHTLTTPKETAAPTIHIAPTPGGNTHGLPVGDIIALAVGLGVGIPTIVVMICAWLCPCAPCKKRRRRNVHVAELPT